MLFGPFASILPAALRPLRAVPFLAALCVAAMVARAQEPAYLAELPDLPLMPGLTQIDEAGLAFDKPDGRIVEAYAGGAVDRQAVRSFYRETLPQLGWERAGGDAYAREGERLKLEFLGADGGVGTGGGDGLTLRFVLTPE